MSGSFIRAGRVYVSPGLLSSPDGSSFTLGLWWWRKGCGIPHNVGWAHIAP